MPKRKQKSAVNRSQDFVRILMNLSLLHSPCASANCTVEVQHCSGCNESYPCKSRQILDGKSVAQLNRQISEMGSETVTLYGDQAEQEQVEDDDIS